MKFAHLADVHIGSWRDPKLRDISTRAFDKVVDCCIKEKIDFMLIAGDLFNTALPDIENLKAVVIKLMNLKKNNIPVYLIPGSHDYSPSGKTMLDILECADLCINVVKGKEIDGSLQLDFTIDKKTGVKITGILGKRGALEKSIYEKLLKDNLEQEPGFKIFMLHSAITELRSKAFEKMVSAPLSLLPKGFNYYAGGHVHTINEYDKSKEGYGPIVYPGPLFPASFSELEELGHGGFFMVTDGKREYYPIQIYNSFPIKINAHLKTPEEVTFALKEKIEGKEFFNTIITIRVEGTLAEGRPTDVNFKEIFQALYDKSAYFVMKNTNKLVSKEFKEINITLKSVEKLEQDLITEHLGQYKLPKRMTAPEKDIVISIINALDHEKHDGERVLEYENRIKEEMDKVLNLHEH